MFSALACGRNYHGTYSNANGSLVIEFKPGHEATVTTKNQSQPCSHHNDKRLIVVDCKEDLILLKINDDNSLTIQEASKPISDQFTTGLLKKTK